MPISKRFLENLLPKESFHIYNRTNNNEDLFKEDINRYHFLQNLYFYLKDYLDIHVYCLLDNHFHLLVTTKSIFDVRQYLKSIPKRQLLEIQKSLLNANDKVESELVFSKVVINQFRRFFLSYTKGINRMYKRNGNLFNRPFKRIMAKDLDYFSNLVLYIHKNPVKHGVNYDFTDYYWSSYRSYLGDEEIIPLKRRKVNDLFVSKSHFIDCHSNLSDYSNIKDLMLEEDE